MMSKPIGGGYPRTLEVSMDKGKVIVTARIPLFGIAMGVVIAPNEHAGKIVVPKLEELISDKGVSHRLTWQLVATIFHAYRQTHHVLTKYGLNPKSGEKAAMLAASEAARDLNLTVLGLEPGRIVTQMRDATRSAYVRFSEAMGVMPIKAVKKQAVKLMTAVQAGADVRGRVNPSMAMAKSRAAANRAMTRLHDEIMHIDPRIEARQKVLVNMIQLTALRLGALNDLLVKLLQPDGLRPLVMDSRRRQVVATQLEYYADDLAEIDFCPYRHACAKTSQDLSEAADLLRYGGVDAVSLRRIRRLLVNCRSAVAIKAQQIEIERLIFRLTRLLASNANAVPVINTVRNRLSAIENQLHKIKEQGFRRPVCVAAGKSVAIAETLLELDMPDKVIELRLKSYPKTMAIIKAAREELKKASATL